MSRHMSKRILQVYVCMVTYLLPCCGQSECLLCVYGTCGSTPSTTQGSCTCWPGYGGRYCSLVDSSKVRTEVSAEAALFYFTQPVLATHFLPEVMPNTTSVMTAHRPRSNAIGVARLTPQNTYTICFITRVNQTQQDAILKDKNYVEESSPCIEFRTARDMDSVYQFVAIVTFGCVGGIVFLLIAFDLFKLCCVKREVRFLNIAQTNEKLLESTIFKIMETRLDLKSAREKIILRKVFRKKRKRSIEEDDIKTRPVIVWFRRTKDRKLVLEAAKKSDKLMVDGDKIMLPPGAGF